MTDSERNFSSESASQKSRCVVLGAGPAGLAAAYELAKSGRNPVVLEKSGQAGGLMRSIKRGSFQVDFGRKEIYYRIPEVVELWEELLGSDFVEYPHRIGILYKGAQVEYSGEFRGIFRGLPLQIMCRAFSDFVCAKVMSIGSSEPKNYEEHWHRKWGELLARILAQGFSEKFYGIDWRDRPAISDLRDSDSEAVQSSLWSRFIAGFQQRQNASDGPYQWRHPKRGTGQFVEAMVSGILANGGTFIFGADVKQLDRSGERIERVHYSTEAGEESLDVEHLVSAIPVFAISPLLGFETDELNLQNRDQGRQTNILYLFLDKPAKFDHAWLNVSCPDMMTGRITNYANFGGEMVPAGKGCIAIEVFTRVKDQIIDLSNEDLRQLLVEEVVKANLLESASIIDELLIRLPGAEASNEFQTFRTPPMIELRKNILGIKNLYECNRAGVDVSVFAGLKAANAITQGDRESFDIETAPDIVPYSNTGEGQAK